ncbi:hypothetical protein A1O3_04213 [Capronia epimyces CBS 606.96]|uniref:L-ornithine N(5)-oxygenase n=1 Tax=Capronia epimyces CBS 606.96 TaxID=1182542 RepID=W9YY76_9EURO|nr:uncharacterized protein A1O3_04213 [Capronia epimyces CBS 606.96]EXJ87254.1 hypothetical protein A1O3_04213 [Capronia epimyces CBS 606.96]
MDSDTRQEGGIWDVVIVGGGWQGIAAAKTYLDLQPMIKLLIVDSNRTIGGVWALENLHPKLNTQNTLGTFEYSWYPMSSQEFGVEEGAHIPGKVVHQYLSAVAQRFQILQRIRFSILVLSAEKSPEGGWLLTVKDSATSEAESFLRCEKLIVATGITSRPRQSNLAGRDRFKGPFLLYADLLRGTGREVLDNAAVSSVTVIGGSKGSYDAVSWAIDAGKSVNWIIQRSGHGPAWMTPAALSVVGFRPQFETFPTRRAFSVLSPCVWAEDGVFAGLRWLLHQTSVGRLLVDMLWFILSHVVLKSLQILPDDLLSNLQPSCGIQWQASSTGTLNYPGGDFYRRVKRANVSIHRQDITSSTEHGLQLGDGTEVRTDAIIHVTGWRWTCPFDLVGINTLEHGIPTVAGDSHDTTQWHLRSQEMRQHMTSRFPYLMKAPQPPSSSQASSRPSLGRGPESTPWCLYRCIAPPCQVRTEGSGSGSGHRDLVFVGFFNTFPKVLLSEIQALWAVAYLQGRIGWAVGDEPSQVQIAHEAQMWSCWAALRYPFGHASKYPDTAFDIIPYFDVLLKDLGLETKRKQGWLKELCSPYGVSDYRGIIEEFQMLQVRGG